MSASFILALIYTATCFWLIRLMLRRRTLISVHLGVLGVFCLGYYPLPVLFKPLSSLAPISDQRVFFALLIHYVFFTSLIAGALWMTRVTTAIPQVNFGPLDHLAFRNRQLLAWVAYGIYLIYVATTARSSYSAENFDDFFLKKSAFAGLIGAVSTFCIAFIAICYASASAKKNRRAQTIYGLMIFSIVVMALPLGSRFGVLLPIITLLAAMASNRQTGKALRILGIGVVCLVIVSPFAVYLREARRAKTGEFLSASEVAGQYQLSKNPFLQSFQSILDRSDLIFNTVFMKDYIDKTGYAGWTYYHSVLVAPIPRLIYPDKPYVLSTDGTIEGEISVKAWRISLGTLGSLTAFGGLTAYREGGWPALILDGLADGALFAVLARSFGYGSLLARMFYCNFFVFMAVEKAPPDFFESLAAVLGHVPLLLGVVFMALLPLYRRFIPKEYGSPLQDFGGGPVSEAVR